MLDLRSGVACPSRPQQAHVGSCGAGAIGLLVVLASPARNAPLAWGPIPRGIRVLVVRADTGNLAWGG